MFFDEIKFNEMGLIPAVIQDEKSGKVLTLCYMNREAFERTIAEGVVYVYRRSAKKLMKKGERSGHVQTVKNIYVDCEGNSILIAVSQKIAACHFGYFTCYFRQRDKSGEAKIIEKRIFDPDKVYKKNK